MSTRYLFLALGPSCYIDHRTHGVHIYLHDGPNHSARVRQAGLVRAVSLDVVGGTYALSMKALLGGAALAASLLVLTGCAGSSETAGPTSQSASAMASPTSTASPSATPTPSKITPSAIATSGSYAADLARLGIKPDSVADYGTWMKKMICDKSGTALGVSVRSIGGDSVASGGGPETVRLAVAYFCPTHSAEVEKEFKYFSQ